MTQLTPSSSPPSLPAPSLPRRDAAIDLKALHPDATFVRILGVNYVHVKTDDGGDMYLTEYGVPFFRHLMPESWYEATWFRGNRERLPGTGTVYRVPTKPIAPPRTPPLVPPSLPLTPSIQLAVKWCRVGQDVPLDTFTLYKNINAEFNTPFEEFALLEELRQGEYGPRTIRVMTQKPLAIYVPPERLQLWQTGRSRDKILARIARRPGVEIDILRSYILIYGWIGGLDALEAFAPPPPSALPSSPPAPPGGPSQLTKQELTALTEAVNEDLRQKGFMVADHKPTHVILRRCNGDFLRHADGRLAYAIVDYELLARTEAHEDAVRRVRRSEYLARQRYRFAPRPAVEFPPHLKPARVLGVDYVFGHTESTAGVLWVVGNDPELFAYFLPERWRNRQVVLSQTGQTYYTQTKDRIHLIWKVSRVGESPAIDPAHPNYDRIVELGYNSPFEKVALALEAQSRGVKSVYPRAIYMTGTGEVANAVLDERRFERLRDILSPEGKPVLPIDHDYITIWGYWRGREDAEAVEDAMLWNPIDASQAAAKGLISRELLAEILTRHAATLRAAGYEDLNLKADHILLSYIPEGPLKLEPDGFPELRHCNFELVRRSPASEKLGAGDTVTR